MRQFNLYLEFCVRADRELQMAPIALATAEAEAAWKTAAQTTALETEDGLPVKDLAEARLQGLQRRPGQN